MLSHSQERRKAKKSLSFHSAHLTHVTSASQSESAPYKGCMDTYFHISDIISVDTRPVPSVDIWAQKLCLLSLSRSYIGPWENGKKKRKCTTYESFQIFSGFKETPPRLRSSSTFLNLESSDQSPSLKYEISRYLAVGIGMVV